MEQVKTVDQVTYTDTAKPSRASQPPHPYATAAIRVLYIQLTVHEPPAFSHHTNEWERQHSLSLSVHA
jgi:hypothetical protein